MGVRSPTRSADVSRVRHVKATVGCRKQRGNTQKIHVVDTHRQKKQYLAAALIPFKTIGRGEQRAAADLLTPSAGYGKPSSSASVAAAPGTSSSSPASLSASDWASHKHKKAAVSLEDAASSAPGPLPSLCSVAAAPVRWDKSSAFHSVIPGFRSSGRWKRLLLPLFVSGDDSTRRRQGFPH